MLRKRFGQHLLTDKNTILDIVQAINPSTNQIICEIGPGLGAITIPVLKSAGVLHAIEIDRDLSKELQNKCMNVGKLILHQSDVLKFNFNDIVDKNQMCRLIGNLPYNISTPLLFHLLQYSNIIDDMHFMLQKEVVDRITASPSNSAYSRLSIMMQSYFKVENLFDITPDKFSPAPKVISSFMRMRPCDLILEKRLDRPLFNKIVQVAFQHRRKTIKNNLASIATETDLQQASINPSQRPQEISMQQFMTLTKQLTN